MANEKHKLESLLEIVVKLSDQKGNEWFKEKLASIFSSKSNVEPATIGDDSIVENIKLIHKYLEIDVVPMIDYSGIEDKLIQSQLYRDCIEMGKYRLGKINNYICFEEFCRYAHLQAEELINYFFVIAFNRDIDKVLSFLSTYNHTYKFYKRPSILSHIDYKVKLFAYTNYIRLEPRIKNNLEFINAIRNKISHRNSLQLKDEDLVMQDFIKKGLSNIKYADIKSLNSEEKGLYSEGKFIENKRLQDWDSIYESLDVLKQSVINSLKV